MIICIGVAILVYKKMDIVSNESNLGQYVHVSKGKNENMDNGKVDRDNIKIKYKTTNDNTNVGENASATVENINININNDVEISKSNDNDSLYISEQQQNQYNNHTDKPFPGDSKSTTTSHNNQGKLNVVLTSKKAEKNNGIDEEPNQMNAEDSSIGAQIEGLQIEDKNDYLKDDVMGSNFDTSNWKDWDVN